MPLWTGYNPPFLSGSNVLPVQHDARLIKNDLIQLLLTAPGERIMRPYIGSPIPGMQFENITDGDISIIKSDIINCIRKFEPRVTVSSVLISLQPNQNMVTINIFGVVNLNPNDKFKIEVGVSDGGVKFVKAQ